MTLTKMPQHLLTYPIITPPPSHLIYYIPLGTVPQVFSTLNMYISNGNTYRLLLHNNYLTGAIPKMAYGYGGFTFTLDNNCQLTSAFPAAVVTSQLHCKPGTAGQRAPSMLPSPSPTPCKSFTLHLTLPFQTPSHHYLFTTQFYLQINTFSPSLLLVYGF